MDNPNKFLKFAMSTARKTGQKMAYYFRKKEPVISGAPSGIKTFYDDIADDMIKKLIEKHFPTHSYLTEETGMVDKKSDYLWIIDPLDGTSNFVNHNPFFSISIALWHKGEPLLGVIEVPILQETFTAFRGHGAFHYDGGQKKRARVSAISSLSNSYLIFCEGGERNKSRIVKIFRDLYPRTREMRKLGSAAIELSWVALGRSEAYVSTQIHLWDIAAGVLFVKEAGGHLLHFDGTPYQWAEFLKSKKFDLAATNSKIKLPLLRGV
ncbi:MAG: inositol monophosphatase family protein [bacterium]|nr:inositol monophosphatase family protein [bacterium]